MASVQYLPNESILRNPLVDTDLSQKNFNENSRTSTWSPWWSSWNPDLAHGTSSCVCSSLLDSVALASRYRILDKSGVMAAVVLACVVGFLGHWSWLLVLLSFLIASHKATKWRLKRKRQWD